MDNKKFEGRFNTGKGEEVLTPDFSVDRSEIVDNRVEVDVQKDRDNELRGGGMIMPPNSENGAIEVGSVKIDERGKPLEEQNPEVAVDGHKLEKEWVERTRDVVEKTKDDPREEEIAVEELKADYLKKRFNRAIGDGN